MHHLRYVNAPKEHPEDLILLCARCHGLFHAYAKKQPWVPWDVLTQRIGQWVKLRRTYPNYVPWKDEGGDGEGGSQFNLEGKEKSV